MMVKYVISLRKTQLDSSKKSNRRRLAADAVRVHLIYPEDGVIVLILINVLSTVLKSRIACTEPRTCCLGPTASGKTSIKVAKDRARIATLGDRPILGCRTGVVLPPAPPLRIEPGHSDR